MVHAFIASIPYDANDLQIAVGVFRRNKIGRLSFSAGLRTLCPMGFRPPKYCRTIA